jgi:hypothetical protein
VPSRLMFLEEQNLESAEAAGQSGSPPRDEPARKKRRLDTLATTPSQATVANRGPEIWVDSSSAAGARSSPLTHQRPTASSRLSDCSEKKSVGGTGRMSQSEFEITEKLNKTIRKQSRRAAANHTPSHMDGNLRSDPIVLDDEPMSKFSGFQQGVNYAPNDDAPPQSAETTSRHFPNRKAKMAHSTDPPRGEFVEERHPTSRSSPPLPLHFRRARPNATVPDEISDDELAPTRKPVMSPTKLASKSKSSPALQTIHGMPGAGFPLEFARAPGFESNEPGLSLRRGTVPNSFRIAARTGGVIVTEFIFAFSEVNKAFTDDASRLRLVGPQKADGAQLFVDIQFVKRKDLILFQAEVSRSITKNQLYSKAE